MTIIISSIYDMLHILFDVLGDEYDEEIVSGECIDDTIKVTKQGSDNAMYIGFDNDYPTVLNVSVYEETEGYHERDAWPIADGIYWDTEDEGLTPQTIAADIAEQF